MRISMSYRWLALFFPLVLILGGCGAGTTNTPVQNTAMVTITPTENSKLLINPGKGWVKYWNMDDSYADIISTGYCRYDWVDIESEEGKFNWQLIDNVLNQFASSGKKFAFGVMCANTARPVYGDTLPDRGKYVTPEWVFDAGAEGREIETTFWNGGSPSVQVIPVWNDQIFLQKLSNFVNALGKRYDGNPNIAFIDIRSYGNWGEQHLGEIGGQEINAEELKTQHLELYKNAFPNTQLITPWGTKELDPTYEWAVTNGIGIRRDGIFKWSDGSECARAQGLEPTVFEYTENYDWIVSQGIWSPSALRSFVEKGKPSYMQFDEKMYKENQSLYQELGNRMGYYFVLKKAVIPATIKIGANYNIQMDCLNKGVSFLYEPCNVAVALLDSNNKVVEKCWLDFDPHTWAPDKTKTESSNITFKKVPAGNYKFAVGLFKQKSDNYPTYKLGIDGSTSNNWYVLYDSVSMNL